MVSLASMHVTFLSLRGTIKDVVKSEQIYTFCTM
jgi:hypothetical protein